ncbi:hypothetical protein Cgig2_000553 [Carnegiea gigantea]|uniref:Uncharacterized protein n=1 Tax=Carnegiea gigantea TaxID=171969 RepID=A0A9Q1GTC3_9CARY|nr:hypothetical protein Cgig2_000553 [Carnegiea gigantea]
MASKDCNLVPIDIDSNGEEVNGVEVEVDSRHARKTTTLKAGSYKPLAGGAASFTIDLRRFRSSIGYTCKNHNTTNTITYLVKYVQQFPTLPYSTATSTTVNIFYFLGSSLPYQVLHTYTPGSATSDIVVDALQSATPTHVTGPHHITPSPMPV